MRLLDREAQKLAQHSGALFVLLVLVSVVRSLHLGQDANWDLKNYHFYDAFALVRSRFNSDLAPAMSQTYFNPLLDLPFYGLVAAGLNPKLIAALMAMPYAFAAFFASKIAWQIFNTVAVSYAGIWWLIACLINLSGAAGAGLVGSTTNDVQVAALVLGAVWVIVRPQSGARTDGLPWRGFVLGGFLIGLAAGLKLTAAPYAIALCVALAIGPPKIQRAVVAVIAYAAACTIGFAISAGPWMLFLYEKFHNPLFPLFNSYFQSPFWELLDLNDTRWGAKSVWGAVKLAVRLPYTLMHQTQGIVAELPIRDWRLASVAGCLCLVVLTSAWRVSRGKSVLAAPPQSHGESIRGSVQILLFFGVGYALWLSVFPIYRYLLSLEMLTGTLIVGLMVVALPSWRVQAAIAFPVVLAILLTTRAPDWERTTFGEHFFEVQLPPVASGSLVLLLDRQPLAYLVPFFPDDTRFVGPWWSGYFNYDFTNPHYRNLLQQRINAEILQHRGPIYSIELPVVSPRSADHNSSPGSAGATLLLYGLRHESKGCQPIRSNLERRDLLLCSLERGT
jgi:hypothetical protein